MDMLALRVTLVIVTVAADVQKIEFVNQAVALQQVNRAIHRDAMDFRVDFLRALQNGIGIQVTLRAFHHLQQDFALARQTNPFRFQLGLQSAGLFMGVNAFALGYTSCSGSTHWVLVSGQNFYNVVVHNHDKYKEQEDHADLNETFFGRYAQFSPQRAFHQNHQNMAAV